MQRRAIWVATLMVLGGCRGCSESVRRVVPDLAVTPPRLEFGEVKLGRGVERSVVFASASKAAVSIESAELRDVGVAGGATAFHLGEAPSQVDGLSEKSVAITFLPQAVVAYEAILAVRSNDPDHPLTEVSLFGQGATPEISVTPECSPAKKCQGTAVIDPPSLDFGAVAYDSLLQVPEVELPTVNLLNAGHAELELRRVFLAGADPSAFSLPSVRSSLRDGTESLTVEAGTGASVPLRFKPTSEQQASYSAELVFVSDDPVRPEVRVALHGTLKPNEAPRVCVNLVKVRQGDGSGTVLYDTPAHWAVLLSPPDGGYDFTGSREVLPTSVETASVTLSATSDADETHCTTDPEDGRKDPNTGQPTLTFLWQLDTALSSGLAAVKSPNSPTTDVLLPRASGVYVVTLEVTDRQNHTTKTSARFAAVQKRDLSVQLSWVGYAGVDLDLHLVRPSSAADGGAFAGAFSFFDEPPTGLTSGDINGFSRFVVQANTPSYNFDWGDAGTADDPIDFYDESGNGDLVETISLNYPEHDPACAASECRYRIMVHYFRDNRAGVSATPCTVGGGCQDGDRCDCAGSDERCVADVAGSASSPSGQGKCFVAPRPTLKVFLRSNPSPAVTLPSSPGEFVLGAPCQLAYLADVVWPAQGSPGLPDGGPALPRVEPLYADGGTSFTEPLLSRFGVRAPGSRECSREITTQYPIQWFLERPR